MGFEFDKYRDVIFPALFAVMILLGHFAILATRFLARQKTAKPEPLITEYRGMTQAADMRNFKISSKSSLEDRNEVIIPNKNHPCNAPFRLVTVKLDSVEAKLLELWYPSWSLNQLGEYLIDHPEISVPLSTNFVPSHSKLMCNPNMYHGRPGYEDRHLGNAEWKECMENVYPNARIEDRKVINFIYCFWREASRGVYYVQWDLCRYFPSLLEQVRENQK